MGALAHRWLAVLRGHGDAEQTVALSPIVSKRSQNISTYFKAVRTGARTEIAWLAARRRAHFSCGSHGKAARFMQVSGLSGSSSAWAVRELFSQQQTQAQEMPSTRQSVPSGTGSALQGTGEAQMSADMLGSLIGMQSGEAAGPPSVSDIASSMISELDGDGDGVVSLEEAEASGASNASEAFATLDADGDGALTADELASSLEQMPPPGAMGPPPSSSDIAAQLLSDLDSDGEEGLSLEEVSAAVNEDASTSETSSGFSSLDSDGDGTLSLAELSAAIDVYMNANLSRFAEAHVDANI